MIYPQGTYACPICTQHTPHQHSPSDGWIGVDFDSTLAQGISRTNPYQLGPPVKIMCDRVKSWLAHGYEVKLMTARMCKFSYSLGVERDLYKMESLLRAWCLEHIGQELECTNQKDGRMIVLWDDRAVRVILDTGMPVVRIME